MASTIRLELVTPERLLLAEEVDEVVAPGHEGEFGVLPEHTQYLAILNIGVLSYRKGSETRKVALGGGVRRARERAEASLKELSLDDESYAKAHAALQRAMVRMAAGGE